MCVRARGAQRRRLEAKSSRAHEHTRSAPLTHTEGLHVPPLLLGGRERETRLHAARQVVKCHGRSSKRARVVCARAHDVLPPTGAVSSSRGALKGHKRGVRARAHEVRARGGGGEKKEGPQRRAGGSKGRLLLLRPGWPLNQPYQGAPQNKGGAQQARTRSRARARVKFPTAVKEAFWGAKKKAFHQTPHTHKTLHTRTRSLRRRRQSSKKLQTVL